MTTLFGDACMTNDIITIKTLVYERQLNIHIGSNIGFRFAWWYGHNDIVHYLLSLGSYYIIKHPFCLFF